MKRKGVIDWKQWQRDWGFNKEFADLLKARLNVKKDLESIYKDLMDEEFYKSNNVFETDARKKRPATIVFQLIFPWVALAVLLSILFTVFQMPLKSLPMQILYVVPPAGKETIIPAMVVMGIEPWLAALSLALWDIAWALFIGWNITLLYKIPIFGRILRSTNAKGKALMEQFTWVRRLAFFGLIGFVAIPFQGSGGVTGTIVGKIIGIPTYKNVLAIGIGAVLGSLILAYGSQYVVFITTELLGPDALWFILITLGFLVFYFLLHKVINRAFKRLTDKPKSMLYEFLGPEAEWDFDHELERN